MTGRLHDIKRQERRGWKAGKGERRGRDRDGGETLGERTMSLDEKMCPRGALTVSWRG